MPEDWIQIAYISLPAVTMGFTDLVEQVKILIQGCEIEYFITTIQLAFRDVFIKFNPKLFLEEFYLQIKSMLDLLNFI